ncbi:beta-ketoacyl-ACP synthase II [Thermodesulfobium sp.]|jgi:3-oxoacyl-[acyl-carrier-protein] synthase II|uniref:3-oxoacyl-[acyl-carrier-protein] synthase 2 n=1 Tax=Thermodesulfobium narugense TaxID=184064 RepID=A0A7C5PAQ7_9BACT
MKRRVVITGMGCVTPLGNDVNTFWNMLKNGKSGIVRIVDFKQEFPSMIAGKVKNFAPEKYFDKKDVRRTSKFVQFAVAAAQEAMEDSGLLDFADKSNIGVCIGSGVGGIDIMEEQAVVLYEKGPMKGSPFMVPMMIVNMASGYVAIKFGLKGLNFAPVSACASSNHAIGEAYRSIVYGDADVMLCGGSEAAVTPLAINGFCVMRALSTCRNNTPELASRPFDKSRDGFVMGEGSGIIILEELNHAINRGAKIYAELVGYGASCDAYHMAAPDPTGDGAYNCIIRALKDASISYDEIDLVNAHATSTPAGDEGELKAIKRVFKDHAKNIFITSNKSMIGHLLGAAGAVELIATVMSVRENIAPPTINLDDPCDEAEGLNLVPNRAQEMKKCEYAISNSFGFGGHNACLIIKKFRG